MGNYFFVVKFFTASRHKKSSSYVIPSRRPGISRQERLLPKNLNRAKIKADNLYYLTGE